MPEKSKGQKRNNTVEGMRKDKDGTTVAHKVFFQMSQAKGQGGNSGTKCSGDGEKRKEERRSMVRGNGTISTNG